MMMIAGKGCAAVAHRGGGGRPLRVKTGRRLHFLIIILINIFIMLIPGGQQLLFDLLGQSFLLSSSSPPLRVFFF
ncbi:unnamed protein product [Cuscuta campestris]|uniref:Uncharacterized protein n=1 Tax=Cuscuta campestris TaxID=132261 RepID=A0A484LPK5_9ASTE|nr:unnamed protein product [Cuscuta campestris]